MTTPNTKHTTHLVHKTLGHAGTIRNACKELLDAVARGDATKEASLTSTIEKRIISMVRDLGMESTFHPPVQ